MAPARPPRVFRSTAARRRFVLHVAVVAIVLSILGATFLDELAFLADVEETRTFVESFGLLAPAALVGLQALQVVAAPVPGQVLAVVAGYLFGPYWGTVYNMIGITIGSTAAFWLARRFGRSYVETVVDPGLLATFDDVDDDRALVTVFVLFLIPGLPDDVLCFVGGLTTVPLWKLVVAAIVGRAPAFFLVNLFGASLGTGELRLASALAVVFVVASALGYYYRERLVEWIEGARAP